MRTAFTAASRTAMEIRKISSSSTPAFLAIVRRFAFNLFTLSSEDRECSDAPACVRQVLSSLCGIAFAYVARGRSLLVRGCNVKRTRSRGQGQGSRLRLQGSVAEKSSRECTSLQSKHLPVPELCPLNPVICTCTHAR